jgi:hypothetical protein
MKAVMALAWAGAVLGPLIALWLALRWRRRWTLLRMGALAGFVAGYLCCVWGFLIEPETLVVRRVAVDSPAWSGAPLRVGVISDVHVGSPHMNPERVGRLVEAMNRERPDVVLLPGDFVGGHRRLKARTPQERAEIARGLAALRGLRAPSGVYAVLGNHDWWYDGPTVEAELRRAGVTVLENDAARASRPGGGFWIGGVADAISERAAPSVRPVLNRSGSPLILMAHEPDPFAEVPPTVALTVAGHDHCGQVNLPLLGRLVHASPGARRWSCGLYVEGGRPIYVTGGVGVSVLPVRFRAPPEIVVITLRGGPAR